jgi:hypothetical protein
MVLICHEADHQGTPNVVHLRSASRVGVLWRIVELETRVPGKAIIVGKHGANSESTWVVKLGVFEYSTDRTVSVYRR